jgi:hypothetical protein
MSTNDRLCGLVVRFPGYRSEGPGFDSRALQDKKVLGRERGPLSIPSTTEEVLGRNSSGSGLERREYGRRDSSRWPRGTLYPQKVALTSLTSGGRSVGIVRLQTEATELLLLRRLSKWIPRYWHLLLEEEVRYWCCGSIPWKTPTSGQVSLRLATVTWVDLDPFAFSWHKESQCWMASRLFCSFGDAMVGSLNGSKVLSDQSQGRDYLQCMCRVLIKIYFFWDIIMYSLMKINQHFWRKYNFCVIAGFFLGLIFTKSESPRRQKSS